MSELELADRAAELRRAFDRAFAEAPAEAVEAPEALIGLRIAGTKHAVRLSEIAGLIVDRRIVPLPSAAPSLLGVSGIRGTVTPVYALRMLLGHPPTPEPPRWIVLARGARVGFAFDDFEGYLRVPRAEIVPSATSAHVREVARTPDAVLALVSLSSIIDSLGQEIR